MPLGTNNPSSTEHFTPPVAATVTVLPPHVYEVSTDPSVYRMAFHQGIWVPNDDSGYYNIHINNDLGTNDAFVGGRAKIAHMAMAQAHGFLNIPNGWKATEIFIDLRIADGGVADGVGNYAARAISMYEVKTVTTDETIDADYAHVSLGNTTTNTVYTLSTEMVGKIDNAMWIRFDAAMATVQFIGGGYITLERV